VDISITLFTFEVRNRMIIGIIGSQVTATCWKTFRESCQTHLQWGGHRTCVLGRLRRAAPWRGDKKRQPQPPVRCAPGEKRLTQWKYQVDETLIRFMISSCFMLFHGVFHFAPLTPFFGAKHKKYGP
jgi:hypothetical protein